MVYGEPTLLPALQSIGALWQARTGVRVNVFGAPTQLSLAQIERGARCDVIVAPAGALTGDATRRELVNAETITPVFRNSLVLIGRNEVTSQMAQAALARDASSLAGTAPAIIDPARNFAGACGLDPPRDRAGASIRSGDLVVPESSADVLSLLAEGKAQAGVVYESDAAAHPEFNRVSPLLEKDYSAIEYVAAEAADPQADTEPFLAFLRSPEAIAVFKAAGLQPVGRDIPR